MTPIALAALASLSLHATPPAEAQATANTTPRSLEGRVYLDIFEPIRYPVPGVTAGLLLPDLHLAFQGGVMVRPWMGEDGSLHFSQAGISLRGGVMARGDMRGSGQRGVTIDFRALAGGMLLVNEDGSMPSIPVLPTVALEGELSYWLAPASGISVKAQAGYMPFPGLTFMASVGYAF